VDQGLELRPPIKQNPLTLASPHRMGRGDEHRLFGISKDFFTFQKELLFPVWFVISTQFYLNLKGML